jgi:hypothetical protein
MGAARAPELIWMGAPALGWLNDVRRDFGFCLQSRRLLEWPEGWRIRWAQRRGKVDGGKAGAAMHTGKAVV